MMFFSLKWGDSCRTFASSINKCTMLTTLITILMTLLNTGDITTTERTRAGNAIASENLTQIEIIVDELQN
jgi:hypothetical protein